MTAALDRYPSKLFVSSACFVINSSVIPSEVEESLNRMSDERKTPEMRAQMTDIERLRHSTAHVLAGCHSERSEAQSRNLSSYV